MQRSLIISAAERLFFIKFQCSTRCWRVQQLRSDITDIQIVAEIYSSLRCSPFFRHSTAFRYVRNSQLSRADIASLFISFKLNVPLK